MKKENISIAGNEHEIGKYGDALAEAVEILK